MAATLSPTAAGLREVIRHFVQERLKAKLDKLEPEERDKRQQLEAAHQPESWLADAARRVTQIQLASHTLKPIHPDARGTNVHVVPSALETPGLVGTHSLNTERAHDVVGNAAALDVFKFFGLKYEDESMLQRVLADDPGLNAAFSDDPEQARTWREAFSSITSDKNAAASHTLAKQLYFPLADDGYHLLAPLFPTSLVHYTHGVMRNDRFGDAAVAARAARRKEEPWPEGFREYPDLAIQNFGGTKPQNISQLNSERYGENWLLPSLPPDWQSADVKPPLNRDLFFDDVIAHQPSVRKAVTRLRAFLANTKHNNLAIREARARLTAEIVDQALQYAAHLRELPPSWSSDPHCRLHDCEQLWLDPHRAEIDADFRARRAWADWPDQVCERFGNWLNSALDSKHVKLGDAEAGHWRDVLSDELTLFKEMLDDDRN